MKNISGKELLELWLNLADVLNDFLEDDILVSVTDREKYLKHVPGKSLNLQKKYGDPVPEGSGLSQAMVKKEQIKTVVPSDVYGVAFKTCSTPILDEEGKVLGSIGLGFNLERQEKLKKISEELSSAFQEILGSVDTLSQEASSIAAMGSRMNNFAEETKEKLSNIEEVINYVKKISKQTNLLGLNSSIEAARAGEVGKGFSVVAEEICKLSDDAASSVENINQTLQDTNTSMEQVLEGIQSLGQATGEQASATQEITSTLDDLTTRVQELTELAARY